jgi:phosphoglycerol transferase MdoB-like AlkP superfamily enzyme
VSKLIVNGWKFSLDVFCEVDIAMDTKIDTNIYNKIINRINIPAATRLRTAVVSGILIKTILFMALLESEGSRTLYLNYISFEFSLVYLAFIGVVFSFGYLLSFKKQVKFYIAFNAFYSILLIFDLWYFRINKDFPGIKNIFFKETFNPMRQSLFRPELIDIVLIVDLLLLIVLFRKINLQDKVRSSKAKFVVVLAISIAAIYISYFLINVVSLTRWDQKLFWYGWSPLMSVRAPGPLGYHGFEVYSTIGKLIHGTKENEVEEIKSWLSLNKEELKDNEYKGLMKGKNVVFLQLESFENFVINRSVNGKEITPFLNKLAREGLYFNNIYEQNNGGNSIDCDLMVSTSILPISEDITATNYGEVVYPKAFPRVLKSEGYLTIATHGEVPGEFNWTELHRNGFGVEKIWDLSHYVYDEGVGYGISDRSFLTQLADKLKDEKQPFYIHVPTMSSHGPFNIDQGYRELDLPERINKSYLGGYFESLHYTDKQLELFFSKLEAEGILDNTMVVLYGDHSGVHKYYNEDIQMLSYEGDWWKQYDHKIPLVIYSKNITPKLIEAYGGHTDIMPTTAYLLGIEDSKYRDYVMGRILVNTDRNATVIKGDIIQGYVKDEKEKEHLLKGYDIGSKIIKNRYK